MKVSTKGRYGLRALVDLAVYEREGHVPLVNIATRQQISQNYLEQVFATLRKAGFVESVKGAQGGYRLSMPPEQIKAGDVLKVLEGPFSIVDESILKKGQENSMMEAVNRLVWNPVNEAVNKYYNCVTIKDLADEHEKAAKKKDGPMYYI